MLIDQKSIMFEELENSNIKDRNEYQILKAFNNFLLPFSIYINIWIIF